jgi:hypothetical protein
MRRHHRSRSPNIVLRISGISTIVLFGGLLLATVARLVGGWGHGGQLTWNALGGAFGISLLVYLASGGLEAIRDRENTGDGRGLVSSKSIGLVGVTLFSLAIAGNLVATFWESAGVLDALRDFIAGSLALCIIAYLIVRYREYRRERRPR